MIYDKKSFLAGLRVGLTLGRPEPGARTAEQEEEEEEETDEIPEPAQE